MAKEGDSILRLEIDVRSKTVIRSSVRGDSTMPFNSFFVRYMSSEPFTSLDENFTFEIIDSYITAKENQVAIFPYDDKNGALVFTFIWMKERPDMIYINVTELNSKVLGTSLHSIDSLTGLYARSHTVSMINSHIKKHKPFNKCGFVLVDINNFKHVNDAYGHQVGDECLKAFASKLREAASPNLVGRYGGDEFIVFVDDTNEQDLAELAKNILATNIVVKVGHKSVTISSCCGISIMNYSAADFSILLQQADKSLKLAKGNNKKEAYMDSKLIAKVNSSNVVTAEVEREKSHKPRLFKDEIRGLRTKYGIIGTLITLACLGIVFLLIYVVFIAYPTEVHEIYESRPFLHAFIHGTIGIVAAFAVLSIIFSIRISTSRVNAIRNKYIDPWTGGINIERFSIYDCETKEYWIIDPNKGETTTYLGGVLDLDANKVFDLYYDTDTSEYKEFLYGEYDDVSDVIYKSADNSAEIEKYDTFNAKHAPDAKQVDIESCIENGVITQENSYTPEQLSKMDLIALHIGVPHRIVLSIYIEGWDRDNTSVSAYGAFYSSIKFKLTTPYYAN